MELHEPDARPGIRILLFSVLKEKVGAGVLTFPLETPATGRELLDALASVYPVLRPYRQVIRLAVNEAYVDEGVSLEQGDEVALITPVSGG